MIHDLIVTSWTFLLMLAVYGFGMHRERARKPPSPKAPYLVCGCGDELSYHEGLGPCRHAEHPLVYTKNGTPIKQDGEYVRSTVPCGCQQYTGDLPADWYARTA